MSTFSTSVAVSKPNGDALRAAIVTLTQTGFAIYNLDEHSAVLTGPGLNSTRQNPLLGASKIWIRLDDQQLQLDAELGGADSLQRFLLRLPLLLGIGTGLLLGLLGLLFGFQFGVGFGVPGAAGWKWLLICCGGALLSLAPWLILSPIMSRMIRTNTQRALTILVDNAVKLSKTAR